MGWNEGILAVKQITDEKKWFQAMEDVRRSFQNEDFFKESPQEDKEGKYSNWSEIGEKDDVKGWEITEPINFCEEGKGFDWDWNDFLYCPFGKPTDKESIKQALEEKKKVAIEEKSRPEYSDPQSWCGQFAQDKINQIDRVLDHLESLSPIEVKLVSSQHEESPYGMKPPPNLFLFSVGESPTLPVFGRHFKMCGSKILAGSDKVIERIFRILHRHFPDHVSHWSEIKEEMYGDLMEDYKPPFKKYFRTAPEEGKVGVEFYKRFEKHFDKLKDAATAEEFRTARKLIAGID